LVDLESEEEQDPHKEAERRHKMFHLKQDRIAKMQEYRKNMISKLYKPLYANIFEMDEKKVFDPNFLNVLQTKQFDSIIKKDTPYIFSFRLFNLTFCKQLMEEIHHFESLGLPIYSVNSMNKYGVVLAEIGFESFLAILREKYTKPLCEFIFGELGKQIDSEHAFIVEYKIGFDEHLDLHYDDSEITLNCCLGDTFEGGSLLFCGLLDDPTTHNEKFVFQHDPSLCVLHLGKHRHAASNILKGERMNVIIWYRSSTTRQHSTDSHQRCNCKST